ncbi:hypothetical protein GCM10023336_31000 [Streptomyces similanensis]|uniref:Uncharacterized protein n=1 Tax=Streptomyces similanensis TaxID=1274988 RepID=A0ABP9KHR0_9ACTN
MIGARSLYLIPGPRCPSRGAGVRFRGVPGGHPRCGRGELGRNLAPGGALARGRSAAWRTVALIPYCVLLPSSGRRPDGVLGKGLEGLMERTVVRCAEGHVFSTVSFPMQQTGRLGPGRLVRCPRCARLRSAVPVTLERR